jgi:hypothetical protein
MINDDSLSMRVKALHERLSLQDVRFLRLSGEVVRDPPFEVHSLSVKMDDPSVLVEPPRFACRFLHRVALMDESQDRLAGVETALLLEFTIEGEEHPPSDAVRTYIDRNALFLAYPYLREAVQSMTLKLGLDPVVLGVLDRGEGHPTEATLTPRSD